MEPRISSLSLEVVLERDSEHDFKEIERYVRALYYSRFDIRREIAAKKLEKQKIVVQRIRNRESYSVYVEFWGSGNFYHVADYDIDYRHLESIPGEDEYQLHEELHSNSA